MNEFAVAAEELRQKLSAHAAQQFQYLEQEQHVCAQDS